MISKLKSIFFKNKKRITLTTLVAALLVSVAGTGAFFSDRIGAEIYLLTGTWQGDPIIQQWAEDATTDFHAYKDTITGITFLNVFDEESSTYTAKTSDVWDVSHAKDESVMAYMVDNEVYICSNVGEAADIIANPYSSFAYEDFKAVTSINNAGYLDMSHAITMENMFAGNRKLASIDVSDWDVSNVKSLRETFYGCKVLTTLALGEWDVSNCEDMYRAFSATMKMESFDVAEWNVGKVKDMAYMFDYTQSIDTIPVEDWDVSNVETMEGMFLNSTIKTLPVSEWDTGKVNCFYWTFALCNELESIDVKDWDTSSVIDFGSMFDECTSLTSINVSKWNTKRAYNFNKMFNDCTSLKSIDVSDWAVNLEKASILDEAKPWLDTYYMFANTKISTMTIGPKWEQLEGTFYAMLDCDTFIFEHDADDDLTLINTPGDEDGIGYVGVGYKILTSPYSTSNLMPTTFIAYNNTIRNIIRAYEWEKDCRGMVIPTLAANDTWFTQGNPATSGGTPIEKSMITSIEMVDLYDTAGKTIVDQWDASIDSTGAEDNSGSVTAYLEDDGSGNGTYKLTISGNSYGLIFANEDSSDAFSEFTNLTTVSHADLLDTRNMTDMSYMFYDNNLLSDIDISTWNTTNVTTAESMFESCGSLSSMDLSRKTVTAKDGSGEYTAWDTKNLQNAGYMFCMYSAPMDSAFALTSVDVTGWDTSSLEYMNHMFMNCENLTEVKGIAAWDTSKVQTIQGLFHACYDLDGIDVSQWETGSLTNARDAFSICTSLTSIDISNWDMSKVTDTREMFYYCPGLTELTIPATLSVFSQEFASYCPNLTEITFLQPADMELIFPDAGGSYGAFYVKDNMDDEDTVTYSKNNPLRTKVITSNKDVLAYDWANDHRGYVITVEKITGGTLKASPSPAINGATITVDAIPASGYSFDGAVMTYIDEEGNEQSKDLDDGDTFTMPAADVTITSSWLKNIVVTYDANGGSFDGSATTNAVTYKPGIGTVTKTSKTANVTYDGSSFSGGYGDNQSITDVVTIPGASELEVTITYATESPYDWVAIYDGSVTPSGSNSSSSISGELRGTTKTTKTYTISGDTVQFYFFSNYKYNNYYGYYATVTASDVSTTIATSGEYKEPSHATSYIAFDGWYTDAACTSGNEFSPEDATSDITVYAKWKEVLPVLAEQQIWFTQGSPTTAKASNISSISMVTSYDTSGKTIIESWDASVGKSGTITAYIEDDGLGAGTYKLTLAGNGYPCIYANANSKNTFYEFSKATSITGLDILDTQNVTSMQYMFQGCSVLTELDVSHFDTQNVTNMERMFYNCRALTSLDISTKEVTLNGRTYDSWDTSSCTNIDSMFYNCSVLTELDVSHFDTRKVIHMSTVFYGCHALTNLDISTEKIPLNGKTIDTWDTGSCTYMYGMFDQCRALTSLDVSHFDTRNVMNMERMFYGCYALTSLDISTEKITLNGETFDTWDTGSCTTMQSMFSSCLVLTDLDISHFDTRKVTKMSAMFDYCRALTNLDISTEKITLNGETIDTWDTGICTDMSQMFLSCIALPDLDVSHFDTRKVTKMSAMFATCIALTDLDISTEKITLNGETVDTWDTGSCTNMNSMFYKCSVLPELDVSHFDTRNVTNIGSSGTSSSNSGSVGSSFGMFEQCPALTSIDLSSEEITLNGETFNTWDTSKVTQMGRLFKDCSNLATADLSTFNTSAVTTGMYHVFMNCSSLKEVTLSADFSFKGSGTTVITTLPNPNTTKYPKADGNWYNTTTWVGYTPADQAVAHEDVTEATTYVIFPPSFTVTYNANGGSFDGSATTNAVAYKPGFGTVTKTSKTANVSDDGSSYSGSYGDNQAITDVVTIPGASELEVTITYATQNANYDWVCVYNGSVTPSESNYSSSTSGKLGGPTKTTKTYTIPGDTVQFFFYSNYQLSNYYGYYATVTGEGFTKIITSGEYEEPSHATSYIAFDGWYTDAACTDGNEFILENADSDITVYAKWFEAIPTLAPNSTWYSQGNPATARSKFTSISLVDEYDISDKTIVESWDASDGKVGSVTAYVEDDGLGTSTYKLTIAGNGYGSIYANADSNNVFGSSSSGSAFYAATAINGLDILDTSNAISMEYMFSNCSKLTSLDVSHFDTRNVGSMNSMFYYCSKLTSLDISTKKITLNGETFDTWDTGNVTNMYYMFDGCILTSLDVSHFDTRNVGSMESMLSCPKLTSLDISTKKITLNGETFDTWDTGNVTTMKKLFDGCYVLTSLDVSHFDTRNVGSMESMFDCCYVLESLDISTKKIPLNGETFDTWDTGNVTTMTSLFDGCQKLTSLDVSHFDTRNVGPMNSMFYSCSKLTSLDISTKKITLNGEVIDTWDTGSATSMGSMFYYCRGLPSLDVSHFDTRNVTSFWSMFDGCSKLTSLDISTKKITLNGETFDTWDTGKASGSAGNIGGGMAEMFESCQLLTSLDVSHFDTSNVKGMWNMFYRLCSVEDLNISSKKVTLNGRTFDSWDTGSVTSMGGMFSDCRELISLDVSYFDTSNVTDMGWNNYSSGMFANCYALTDLDISTKKITLNGRTFDSWNTSKVTNMSRMFYYCESLTSLDVRHFDTRAITETTEDKGLYQFARSCNSLTSIALGQNFGQSTNLQAAGSSTGLFYVSSAIETSVTGANPVMLAYDWATDNRTVSFGGLSEIVVTTMPTTTSYGVGDDFDPAGMEITATYGDGSTKNITDYTVLNGTDLTIDQTSLTVQYTEDGLKATCEVPISVGYLITYDANSGVFGDDSTINSMIYKDQSPKISKTANVSANGSSYSGGYGNNIDRIDFITAPGASSMEVTITYQTWNKNYDFVCVYDGSVTPSGSNYSSSISGKLGGTTKTKKTYTIPGDTVQIYFRTDNSGDGYYGYYATVTPVHDDPVISGTYEEPTMDGYTFAGWYTDANCTKGNELDFSTVTENTTAYAKWVQVSTLSLMYDPATGTVGGYTIE